MHEIDFGTARVAILGIGREGQAVRRYLRRLYPGIPLTLLSESSPDRVFAAELGDFDRLLVGPLAAAGLASFDLLIRSPGISVYRESLQRARAAGVRVTTASSLWFAAHPEQKTLCVTGTKGKSTTCALLAHLLRSAGHRVQLAGNIGLPLLACEDRGVDWWVIELSSFQLADLEARPDVALVLNFSPEHLDWHGSAAAYRRDKLRLAELAAGGTLIANAADPVLREAFAGRKDTHWFNGERGIRAQAGGVFSGERRLPVGLPRGLPGAHNLSNAAAALTALELLGGDVVEAARDLSSFRSLPHRLQRLGQRDGVYYVNDSISSTPVATVAALRTLTDRPLTLIVGGLDRGLDWQPYVPAFRECTLQAVIAVPDNGVRIVECLREGGVKPVGGFSACEDLAGAVARAKKLTPRGGVVLLSPGAPSFPQFRDYRERGARFAIECGFRFEVSEDF
ncbi:MAG: UDP-N-acetylmuramoyl-L-alanine--D-glutamate ligase [Xanthomonadales bacterium]|nr:UDP-N-acetylmuramoyl-L-alanine--D-glutamate ligase [Xanthomonadales bacterium]